MKKTTSLEELNGIKNELGKNFEVTLQPKDKTTLTIVIEAPSSDYITLLNKKTETPKETGTLFDENGNNKNE